MVGRVVGGWVDVSVVVSVTVVVSTVVGGWVVGASVVVVSCTSSEATSCVCEIPYSSQGHLRLQGQCQGHKVINFVDVREYVMQRKKNSKHVHCILNI